MVVDAKTPALVAGSSELDSNANEEEEEARRTQAFASRLKKHITALNARAYQTQARLSFAFSLTSAGRWTDRCPMSIYISLAMACGQHVSICLLLPPSCRALASSWENGQMSTFARERNVTLGFALNPRL
jgi:hypothetical protein